MRDNQSKNIQNDSLNEKFSLLNLEIFLMFKVKGENKQLTEKSVIQSNIKIFFMFKMKFYFRYDELFIPRAFQEKMISLFQRITFILSTNQLQILLFVFKMIISMKFKKISDFFPSKNFII